MDLTIAALIIVVIGFTAITLYVFYPGNKAHFEDSSRIPLDKDQSDNFSSDRRN